MGKPLNVQILEKLKLLTNKTNNLSETILAKKIEDADANEIYNEGTGLFAVNRAMKNFPTNGENQHFHLIQILFSKDYVLQIITSIFPNGSIFVRRKSANTWEAWKKITLTNL